MKWPVLISITLLTACGQSAGEKAEAQYEMVAKNEPGYDARCAAAGRAKEAWLQEGREPKYQHWQTIEYVDCSKAARGAD